MKRKNDDLCDTFFFDPEKVKKISEKMLKEKQAMELARLFQAMGDPSRVKIIFALWQQELCVCDLAHLLGLSVSAVSHQLRLLRNLRLVKYRRDGRMVYYSLDDVHIEKLFNEGLEHIKESK
jgi:ArsR family transcriptional regulator